MLLVIPVFALEHLWGAHRGAYVRFARGHPKATRLRQHRSTPFRDTTIGAPRQATDANYVHRVVIGLSHNPECTTHWVNMRSTRATHTRATTHSNRQHKARNHDEGTHQQPRRKRQ